MSTEDVTNIAGIATQVEAVLDNTAVKQAIQPVKMRIGISVSNSPDMGRLGYTHYHLQDALTETARYLLANHYHLVYGGDTGVQGFTHQLADLAKQYTPRLTDNMSRVDNYLAWPLYVPLTISQEADFKSMGIHIIKCPAPSGASRDQFLLPDTVAHRLLWAQSLLQMRQTMVQATGARIIMGGQVTGYKGRIPGVAEEAWLALQAKKPLYICGAWGGAAKAVIEAITTGNSGCLTEEWQYSNNPGYALFMAGWNDRNPGIPINYSQLVQDFFTAGIEQVSMVNKLTPAENLRLFVTPHPQEMMYLILKGLSRLQAG